MFRGQTDVFCPVFHACKSFLLLSAHPEKEYAYTENSPMHEERKPLA